MRGFAAAIALAAACYRPVAIGGGSGDGGPPSAPVSRFGVGARFACALDSAGFIACWGYDGSGQLGDGQAVAGRVGTPALIPPPGTATAWTDLAVGAQHACGIAGGSVYCWGDDSIGQTTGSAGGGVITAPAQVDGLTGTFTAVAAGTIESCALDSGGAVTCWGQVDPQHAHGIPASIPGSYQGVSVGAGIACAVTTAGGVTCWGSCTNECGAIETAGSGVQLYDFPLDGTMAMRVVAGDHEVCAIDSAGALHCTGSDPPFAPDARVWTDVALGPRIAASDGALTVGATCGVTAGSAMCWGVDSNGSIPDGTWGHSAISYTAAHGIGAATQVALGLTANANDYDEGGCLLDGSAIACWGNNRSGELVNGDSSEQLPTVIAPPDSGKWTLHIAASSTHTCAWTTAGHLYCWGQNVSGECTGGSGNAACPNDICARPVLAPIPNVTTQSDLVVGEGFTCALDTSVDEVSCWGDNERGQLGGTTPDSNGVQVLSKPFEAIAGGGSGACGFSTDETDTFCWGGWNNTNPDLPAGDLTTPQVLPGVGQLKSVVVGQDSACVSTGGDNRECWGANDQGQLGLGTTNPGQYIGTNDAESRIAGTSQHYCEIFSGNTVDCWGTSYDFESGIPESEPNNILAPQSISDSAGIELTSCTDVATGLDFGCAICGSPATVSCWGKTVNGALGELQGTLATDVGSGYPVALDSSVVGTPTVIVAGGSGTSEHACAVGNNNGTDTDTGLECWGFGPRGELGTGAQGSPVPVAVSVP